MVSTNTTVQLLDLPAELRTQILSFLLPDLPKIECDVGWSPTANGPPRDFPPSLWTPGPQQSAYRFRSDEEECHTAILRTCKRLHMDGASYLYRQKTYKIHVFDYGVDFLNKAGDFAALPQIPYHEMKELIIEIVDCDSHMAKTGTRLRENLLLLCGLLSHHNVHLKKLRIQFSPAWSDWWNTTWDETESEECRPPAFDETKDNSCNAELAAWECGFNSTFEYITSPLALLPTVDACTVEVSTAYKLKRRIPGPEELDEEGGDGRHVEIFEPHPAKQHVLDWARWYRDRIDGTYAFEEDWSLKRAREEFADKLTHPH
ncbi:MAG: hypothetical protein Q9208_004139 [Pyrenodesmia sp. 3 TL-2023]